MYPRTFAPAAAAIASRRSSCVQVMLQQVLQFVVAVVDALGAVGEDTWQLAVARLLEEQGPGRGRLERPHVGLADGSSG